MLDCFAPGATYRYVPFGAQGSGLVEDDAEATWEQLIEAFDGFMVEVQSIRVDGDGYAFCEICCGGRQACDVFGVENKGGEFWLESLVVLRANRDGLVDEMKVYWDRAGVLDQLGAS